MATPERWDTEKLLAILRTLEFVIDDAGEKYCPWCGASEERGFHVGHDFDCELARAIGARCKAPVGMGDKIPAAVGV